MINEKNIYRDLYQHRWMVGGGGGGGGPTDANKQSVSAVRASGGFPGNVKRK